MIMVSSEYKMDAIPLVLIPGLLCTAELWAPQIAGLSDLARISIADHGVADDMAGIARAILAAAPARFALAGPRRADSQFGFLAFPQKTGRPGTVTRTR